VRDARPAVRELADATPYVTRAGAIANKLLNLLAYNPNGREGPEVLGREEGMLFWLGWLNHNANAIFANSDAHGPLRPLAHMGSCGVLIGLAQALGGGDAVTGTALHGLQGVFTDPRVCGGTPAAQTLVRKAGK
jgi:phospholipid/cholesterol/gamma-HCH transport system substrate-binding protein